MIYRRYFYKGQNVIEYLLLVIAVVIVMIALTKSDTMSSAINGLLAVPLGHIQ